MLTVTRSNARCPYIRYMVSNSGSSLRQGAHHVAQNSTSRSLPVEFLRRALRSSVLVGLISTGRFSISSNSDRRPASLYSHLVEQPIEGVFATATGEPA